MNYHWDRPGTIHHMLRTPHGNINIDVHAIEGDKHWDIRWHIDEDKSKNLHFVLIPVFNFSLDECSWIAKRLSFLMEGTNAEFSGDWKDQIESLPSLQCDTCKTFLRIDSNPHQRVETFTCASCMKKRERFNITGRDNWTFEQTVVYEDHLFDIAYLEFTIACLEREYLAIEQDTHQYTKLLEEQAMMIVNQEISEENEQFLTYQRMVAVRNRYAQKVSDDIKKKKRKLKRRQKDLAFLKKLWKDVQ